MVVIIRRETNGPGLLYTGCSEISRVEDGSISSAGDFHVSTASRVRPREAAATSLVGNRVGGWRLHGVEEVLNAKRVQTEPYLAY